MANTIDVHDLPEKDVHLVQALVNSLREKYHTAEKTAEEHIEFGEWPLGVKGNLTREEIYEDR